MFCFLFYKQAWLAHLPGVTAVLLAEDRMSRVHTFMTRSM